MKLYFARITGLLALSSILSSLFIFANAAQAGSEGSPVTLDGTLGEQHTAVILLNFQNHPNDQPVTVEQVRTLMFGDVDAYYREVSSGLTWFAGDVYGWLSMPYDLPLSSADCAAFNLSGAAQQAVFDAGINLTVYTRLVYVYVDNPCYGVSSGSVGGNPSRTWVSVPNFKSHVVAHELGHNLGLSHAGALECGSVTEGGSCNVLVYGDQFDLMGNGGMGHFGAPHKEMLGWLGTGDGSLIEATGGGYTLVPLELPRGSGVQALKIRGATNASTGATTWYYLEYRQAIGADGFLGGGFYASPGDATSGVLVHRITAPASNAGVSSILLDMTPDGSPSSDWLQVALTAGQSYTDPVSGVSFQTDAVSSSGAAVTVYTGGAATCTRGTPTLGLLSAGTQSGSPGDTLSWQLTIGNTDSAACPAASIALDLQLPSGWTASPVATSVTLAPGAQTNVPVQLTSATGAATTTYSVPTSATHSSTGSSAGVTLTYSVQSASGGNQAPVAVDDQASTGQNTAVTIAVLSNDYDPEGASLSIASVQQPAHGSVTLLSDGRVSYEPDRRYQGTDSFVYAVTDGALKASATVQISVQKSTGGGGSGGGGKGRNK